MKRYHTGYFLTFKEGHFSPEEYSKHFIKQSNLKLTKKNYQSSDWSVEWLYSKNWRGLEFIINATSFDVAQNALFNIHCAMSVIEGKGIGSNQAHYPHEYGTTEKLVGTDLLNKPLRGFSSINIPKYFHLAILSCNDVKIENSIIKYQLSTEIYAQEYMDLDEVIDWKTTSFSYIQMRFAYAIITAYSVIEELGLNVNVSVSSNRRSILENGCWNPEVLDDLVGRLKNSNIDINEDMFWMIRGDETEIEKKKPIRTTRSIDYSCLSDAHPSTLNVKDNYVYIPDAINYVSFLRSSISSHSVGKRIMNISVYDVANAQNLARRLILENIRHWK